jgi:hypothetical protein
MRFNRIFQDCGKPYYLNNYLVFFGALSARYPHLRLVSNCDMGADAPTDLWDWHAYLDPAGMFAKRTEFDGRDPKAGHLVFASEVSFVYCASFLGTNCVSLPSIMHYAPFTQSIQCIVCFLCPPIVCCDVWRGMGQSDWRCGRGGVRLLLLWIAPL